eukprot:TRINITY_DN5662_c0_g1_i1.p1 TRINITY_DN5662_c0_g1~~TRINITY_DN5662_c0_g1_i1.p1  ORF type:complete len:399 (+),score=146.76 TRINITY_DN5662_c0_g1_i1:94-1290(+)
MSVSGSFTAVISLRTPEEVQELVGAVTRVVESSVTLFDMLKQNNQSFKPLLSDIITMARLSATFEEICLSEDGKERTRQIVAQMNSSKTELGRVFLGLQGRYPIPDEQRVIVKEVQNVLAQMALLTDEMEEDQIDRVKEGCKYGVQAIVLLKNSDSDYRIDQKINQATNAFDQIIAILENRLNVINIQSDAHANINAALENIRINYPYALSTTKQYVTNFQPNDHQQQEYYLTQLAQNINIVMQNIDDTRQHPKHSFNYGEINKRLDEMQKAVINKSPSLAAQNAKYLVDEINGLQAKADNEEDEMTKQMLEESCNKLKQMTANLIAATKTAIANENDVSNANLVDALKDVKQEVAQVAVIEAPEPNVASSASLRSALLKAAADMANNMDSMVNELDF